jgi:hypothetical protein
LNQSYNNLYNFSQDQEKEIGELEGQNEDLLNENINLQNRDFFNVVFQDGNIYYEFFDITIRKDVVIVVNIMFSFMIYLGVAFKFNFLNIRLMILTNLSHEQRKKFEKTVDLFHDLGQRLNTHFKAFDYILTTLMIVFFFLVAMFILTFILGLI